MTASATCARSEPPPPLAHHRALATHHPVEERGREEAHDEEGGEPAEHRDEHVGEHQSGRETVHGAPSIGVSRNL